MPRPDETTAQYNIRTRLGVTPAQARLLAKLYEGNGKAVSANDLLDACSGHWDVYPEVLKVQVSKIRRRLGADMIPNVWSVGYRLSLAGMETVRGALA